MSEFQLHQIPKPVPMGVYPLDALIIGPAWEGWAQLQDHHPAMLNGATAVRLVKGGTGTEVRAGKRVRELATAGMTGTASSITVTPLPVHTFTRIGAQPADTAGDRTVMVDPDTLAALEADTDAEYFRVACPATGCSFFVTRKELTAYPEGSEREGTIKLSRYQRMLLRIQPPLELSELHHGAISPTDHAIIDAYYTSEDGGWPRLRSDDLSFPETQRIMGALNRSGFFVVTVSAVVEKQEAPLFAEHAPSAERKAWYAVARAYLGSRTYVLRVVRPHDIDESREVVRLSQDTMNSLGIEDTDLVRLRYGSRSITARAMTIADEDQIRQNSYLSKAETLDAVIGIPVGLRAKLGVPGIHESVRVDRDVNHLLRKTLNVYVLSALAWLFTLLQVVPQMGISMWWTVAAFAVALPVIVYAAAAPRRAQVRDVN